VKAIWLDLPLLSLRSKAAAASRMALYQQWAFKRPTRASEELQAVSERATRAANTIEALVSIFGALLRPGGAR
jgi:hypothetical protein